jgi:spore coat protein U-like protein
VKQVRATQREVLAGAGHIARIVRGMTILIAAIGVTANGAFAACSVSTQGVSFGPYNPISGSAVDGTGNVVVTCDTGTAYAIALSSGSATYADRTMTSGSDVLHYNLYTSLAHAIVWGDGTGGSSTVGGSGTGAAVDMPVYGHLPGSQNVPAGNYTDTIVVTVDF